ncbi:hypothetical protein BGZ49_003380, partial [Haplosporangium sp. Z 27]
GPCPGGGYKCIEKKSLPEAEYYGPPKTGPCPDRTSKCIEIPRFSIISLHNTELMVNQNCYIGDDEEEENYCDRNYAEGPVTEHQMLRRRKKTSTMMGLQQGDHLQVHDQLCGGSYDVLESTNLDITVSTVHWIIPDSILLSVFFNPVCAPIPMLDLPVAGGDGMTLRDKAKALVLKVHISLSEEESTSNYSSQSGQSEPQGSRSEPPEHTETYSFDVKENSEALKYSMDIPQDYWRDRSSKSRYAKLVDVACSYVCVQVTSNDSERLFS